MVRPLLYVIPHAGGAAYAYQPLVKILAPEIEVCCLELPGHGRRTRERPLDTFQKMVDDLLRGICPASNRVWAIFGHSMGALLGHAVCQQISHNRFRNLPAHLFVSGTSAPGKNRYPAISNLPDNQFWNKLSRLGGLPKELLASSELREYFEDILRQDFRAVENYEPDGSKFDVPLTVFYGTEDMNQEEAESWRSVTSNYYQSFVFPGDHFFLFDVLGEISQCIRQTLQKRACPL